MSAAVTAADKQQASKIIKVIKSGQRDTKARLQGKNMEGMAKKLAKIVLIIILIAALCMGLYFSLRYVYASETPTSSDSSDDGTVISSSDVSGTDADASTGGNDVSGTTTTESSGSESSVANMLAFGSRYVWASEDSVVTISYTDTTTYYVTAAFDSNTATKVTATLNIDTYFYGLCCADYSGGYTSVTDFTSRMQELSTAQYDLTNTFNYDAMFDVIDYNQTDIDSSYSEEYGFDAYVYKLLQEIDLMEHVVLYAAFMYANDIPLINITATDGTNTATYGLKVYLSEFDEYDLDVDSLSIV